MYGILTNLEYEKHWIFKNYYFSLINVFGKDKIKRIFSINDLADIDVLFIGDEHFIPNKEIWMNNEFIKKCNDNKIKVIVFNNEKIFNSVFPWNEGIQKMLNNFNDFKQFVYDCDDSDILNTEINKTYMSSYYKKILTFDYTQKKDKIVFFGKTKGSHSNDMSYVNRANFINEIKKHIEIDIYESNDGVTMEEYLKTISGYKYVLSPMGNGNFVPMRYYESLFVQSIPLQQSTDNIIKKFNNEIIQKRGIFFKDTLELLENINEYNVKPIDYFMEDFINDTVLPIII